MCSVLGCDCTATMLAYYSLQDESVIINLPVLPNANPTGCCHHRFQLCLMFGTNDSLPLLVMLLEDPFVPFQLETVVHLWHIAIHVSLFVCLELLLLESDISCTLFFASNSSAIIFLIVCLSCCSLLYSLFLMLHMLHVWKGVPSGIHL
jgi:hypothetical protein